LKNQINLINLRLTKEGESRTNAEDALRKNNERFTTDTSKYSNSLRGGSKDNETLALKLQDTDKIIYKANLERKDLESRLQNKTSELEDIRKK